MTDWKPLSTCPREPGVPILLGVKETNPARRPMLPRVCWWDGPKGSTEWGYFIGWKSATQPTHWAPISEVPFA